MVKRNDMCTSFFSICLRIFSSQSFSKSGTFSSHLFLSTMRFIYYRQFKEPDRLWFPAHRIFSSLFSLPWTTPSNVSGMHLGATAERFKREHIHVPNRPDRVPVVSHSDMPIIIIDSFVSLLIEIIIIHLILSSAMDRCLLCFELDFGSECRLWPVQRVRFEHISASFLPYLLLLFFYLYIDYVQAIVAHHFLCMHVHSYIHIIYIINRCGAMPHIQRQQLAWCRYESAHKSMRAFHWWTFQCSAVTGNWVPETSTLKMGWHTVDTHIDWWSSEVVLQESISVVFSGGEKRWQMSHILLACLQTLYRHRFWKQNVYTVSMYA